MNYLKNIPYLSEEDCTNPTEGLLRSLQHNFGSSHLFTKGQMGLAEEIHMRYFRSQVAITVRHKKEGVQWVVPAGLMEELGHVDLVGLTFEDVPWPAMSIEFYFEDKGTPTVLFQVKIKGVNLDQPKGELFVMYYPHPLKDDPQAIAVEEDELRQFFKTGTTDYLSMVSNAVPGRLDVQQSASYLVTCLKLLLLAGTPQYAPQKISRKVLEHGGRAGVNNRPRRPVYRFLTLPHIIGLSEHSGAGSGGTVSPHFRRGHFRMLRSEVFTQKKGQIVYVRPALIHGGNESMPTYHIQGEGHGN